MEKRFQIVTDSSCDLPQALADELDLAVLPLHVLIGEHTYANYLDGREIGFREFLLSELDVQASGESVLTEIVRKPQECTKASATETAHERAFLSIEAIRKAALVATEMNFGIFLRVVGFLEDGDEVGATFVEIFVVFDIGWIDFDADSGETFGGKFDCFADPLYATHALAFTGEDEDILQASGSDGVKLFDEIYSTFGLTYQIELSTMPEDHMGDEKIWHFAEETLQAAIQEMGKDFILNPGDGAFYGPKLDFHLADSLGRTWQCGTIQLDSQLPERFELEYTGEDGQKHRPVMLHRVVLGSIERFIGVITEHFAGKFPLWLSPVQAVVLPISEHHHEYAQGVQDVLEEAGFRVECDLRNEKIGYKIREAQLQRTPYMIVVGDKEAAEGTISVRHRADGDLGSMDLPAFIAKLKEEVESKEIK